ncbi:MAG: branched-chain amino acid transporter permease [Oscillospiraceae bacterium]
MMTTFQAVITVAVIALGTLITRALPFLAFPAHRTTPRYVVYLGRVLPFAITAMLIVYCLKDVAPTVWPHGIPEVIALVVVAALFLIFKNSLVAIAAGTICYMVLVQWAFA